MTVYKKLVRDRIPEIIKNNGQTAVTKILSIDEYKLELQRKSKEELQEYLNAKVDEEAIEELADLLEIIHALAKVHGTTIDQIEQIRQRKAEERGGFEDRVFLIEVKDD